MLMSVRFWRRVTLRGKGAATGAPQVAHHLGNHLTSDNLTYDAKASMKVWV